MKVIIAGSRSFNDITLLFEKCDSILSNSTDIEIVSGCAHGADELGLIYAEHNGYKIRKFPVTNEDFKLYGRAAGPIRNTEMANYAEALIAFWDGKSSGTKDMIEKAQKKGLKIRIIHFKNEK